MDADLLIAKHSSFRLIRFLNCCSNEQNISSMRLFCKKHTHTHVYGKNDFTEVSKNLTRYNSENNFIGPK